jgi:hypothetical protein
VEGLSKGKTHQNIQREQQTNNVQWTWVSNIWMNRVQKAYGNGFIETYLVDDNLVREQRRRF